MGNLENSIKDFDQAIKLDDRNPIIYSNRGLVNRKLERYELAIDDYTNEIKYSSDYQDQNSSMASKIKAYNNRAYCLAKLGRYQDAIIDYTTVIK
jgi:tetratricopeptide (TPR) repeat protein